MTTKLLTNAYRNIWSAAELQAENEDDSWSALMYSAFSVCWLSLKWKDDVFR
jgi:hypothetical protein